MSVLEENKKNIHLYTPYTPLNFEGELFACIKIVLSHSLPFRGCIN
jgi:hypothetical protein